MWIIKGLIVLLLSTQLLFVIEARSKNIKSVTTLLDAKWEVTPLILEIAEYLADENINYFWSYIDSISSLRKAPVDIGKLFIFCIKVCIIWFVS